MCMKWGMLRRSRCVLEVSKGCVAVRYVCFFAFVVPTLHVQYLVQEKTNKKTHTHTHTHTHIYIPPPLGSKPESRNRGQPL